MFTTIPPSRSRSIHQSARIALAGLFLVDGMGFGLWAALLPSLQERLALDHAQLSHILFGMVTGAFVAMPVAGKLLARCGSPAVLRIIAPAYSLVLILPVIAPSLPASIVAAALFGALKGTLDVSINSQAVVVESRFARPIMASFQALWSGGGLIAALLASLSLRLGGTPFIVTLITMSGLLVPALRFPRRLLEDRTPLSAVRATQNASIPRSGLPALGALAFMALFVEGVMMDWSAIFAREVGGAETWLAPVAYGIFCVSMAGGRASGDRILARYGAPRVLRMSGVLCALGTLLMVCWPIWPMTFLGLLLAGSGIANLVPIFFTAAGNLTPRAVSRSIAFVATLGYLGFLAGPPLVGMLASAISLRHAVLVGVVAGMILAGFGPLTLRLAQRAK